MPKNTANNGENGRRTQFQPGNPGRPAGTPNKTTRDARQAIAELVEGNIERLQEWLERVAATDPAKALGLFVTLLEYHVPKLSRSDVSVSEAPPRELTPTELAARVAHILHRAGARVVVEP